MSSPRMAKAARPTPVPMPAAAPVLSPDEDEDEVGVGAGLVLEIVPVVERGGDVVVVVAAIEVDGADV